MSIVESQWGPPIENEQSQASLGSVGG